MLRYIESQEEFDRYSDYFKGVDSFTKMDISTSRSLIFYPRLWLLKQALKYHFKFGPYDPTKEGLEIKFACESAEDVGARLEFMGSELDQQTRDAIYHETRFNLPSYLIERIKKHDTRWAVEREAMIANVAKSGYRTWIEKSCDEYMTNWYIQNLALFFPHLKK